MGTYPVPAPVQIRYRLGLFLVPDSVLARSTTCPGAGAISVSGSPSGRDRSRPSLTPRYSHPLVWQVVRRANCEPSLEPCVSFFSTNPEPGPKARNIARFFPVHPGIPAYTGVIALPLDRAGLPWYTCTNLSGVECLHSPGAKHRSPIHHPNTAASKPLPDHQNAASQPPRTKPAAKGRNLPESRREGLVDPSAASTER